MHPYEGQQNNLRNRYAQPKPAMSDLPYKPGMSPDEIAERARLEWEEEQKKKARREAAAAKRKATAATAKKRPSISRQSTEHPTRSRKAGTSKASVRSPMLQRRGL